MSLWQEKWPWTVNDTSISRKRKTKRFGTFSVQAPTTGKKEKKKERGLPGLNLFCGPCESGPLCSGLLAAIDSWLKQTCTIHSFIFVCVIFEFYSMTHSDLETVFMGFHLTDETHISSLLFNSLHVIKFLWLAPTSIESGLPQNDRKGSLFIQWEQQYTVL